MPVYEYEPDDRDCLMCEGRVSVIQGVNEEHLKYCPWCGLDVKRVISRASFKVGTQSTPEQAAAKGFTTFKKSEKGVWEKLAGEGADFLVGSKEDMAQIEAEKKPAPKLNLDGS